MTLETERGNDLSAPASGDVDGPGEPAHSKFAAIVGNADRFALLALFIIILVVFSFTSDHFATLQNFRVILGSQAVVGILAIGVVIPLVGRQFDLSVGANLGVTTIATAAAMSRFDLPLIVAILIGISCGLLIGVVNGLMIAKIGADSFISTLAMATLLAGLVEWYTSGNTISGGISHSLATLSVGNVGGIPKGLIWFAIVAVAAWYLLEHTPWGRYLTSVGSNPNAAHVVGLPVSRLTLTSLVICGGLGGIAGVLLVGQNLSATPNTVQGAALLPAYAAAFLGASAFKPGKFNIPGTFLAIYFVAFSVSGLEFAGVASWIQPVFNGVALGGAVAITAILGRRKGRVGLL